MQLDLEILQTITAVSQNATRIHATAASPVSRAVTGIQKLVQRYVLMLTTALGSSRFDSAFGTTFWRDVSRGISRNSAGVANAFNFASADTIDILRAEDADTRFGEQPDDERIASAVLTDFGVDTASGSLYFTVEINSAAGTSYTYKLPLDLTGDSR